MCGWQLTNISRTPQDIQAHVPAEMAVYTSDTVEHDIVRSGTGEVMVFNLCTDTTRHINGIVTNMHPSEGVWLFRSKLDILEMLEVLELLASTNIFFEQRSSEGQLLWEHVR